MESDASGALARSLRPHAIAGDWDSIRPEVADFYAGIGVQLDKNVGQDDNDLWKSLQSIERWQTQRQTSNASNAQTKINVVIYGAFGGRLDQEIQNLNALYAWDGVFHRLVIASSQSLACLLPAGNTIIRVCCPHEGPTCGLLPLGRPVTSLTTHGLQWDVSQWPTRFGGNISTSNSIKGWGTEGDRPVVQVESTRPYEERKPLCMLYIMSNATNYLRQEFRGDALKNLAGLQVQAYDEEELAGKVLEAARVRGETGVATAASVQTIEALLQTKLLVEKSAKPGLDRDKIRLQVQLLQKVLKVKRAASSSSSVGLGASAASILDSVGRGAGQDNEDEATTSAATSSGAAAASSAGSNRFVQSRSMPLPPPSASDTVGVGAGVGTGVGAGKRARPKGGVRFAGEEEVQLIPAAAEAGEVADDTPDLQPARPSSSPSASPPSIPLPCPVCARSLVGYGERDATGHVDRCLRRGSQGQDYTQPKRATAGKKAVAHVDEGDASSSSDSGASDTAPREGRKAKPFAAGAAKGGSNDSPKSKRRRKTDSDQPALRAAPNMSAVIGAAGGGGAAEDDFAQGEGEEVDGQGGAAHAEEDEDEVSLGAIKATSGKGKLSRSDRLAFSVRDDWDSRRWEARTEAFEAKYGDGSGPGDLQLQGGTAGGGLTVPHYIASQLLPYQSLGVAWLWGLHKAGVGGCLGDEMGLGKTVQMVALLGALHAAGRLRPTIIVCPATVIAHWVRELTTWWPPLRVLVLHDSGSAFVGSDTGSKVAIRRQIVKTVLTSGDIVVTTYEALRLHSELLLKPKWGYAVLDEGHKVRNPESGVTQAAKALHTVHRLILTGAPIQNRLKELWSLFDFCYPGRLGSLTMFESQFTQPIAAGGWSHATPLQVSTAVQCALVLRDLISPYLLRRLKRDVASQLPTKTEQVLFCRLSPLQRAVYVRYLRGREVADVLNGTGQAFKPITVLRKLCNHPRLLEADDFEGGDKRALRDLLLQGDDMGDEEDEEEDEDEGGGQARGSGKGKPRKQPSDPVLEGSDKMKVMGEILRLWKQEGRRCLLFCQGTRMLDLVQAWVVRQGWGWLRMDGTTPVGTRQVLVDAFNTQSQYFVFLLTTRVGGVGVNLIGADRVLIFDPDWNPSTDTQARERAWRLGQRKHVTIYRLITAGTIEEKIYHRQIFKTVLTQRVLADPRTKRLFSYQDLRDLFTLSDDPGGQAGAGSSSGGGGGRSRSSAPVATDTSLMVPEGEVSMAQGQGEAGGGDSSLEHAGLVGLEAYHDPDSQGKGKGAAGVDEGDEDDDSDGEERKGGGAPDSSPDGNGPTQTKVLATLIDGGVSSVFSHDAMEAATSGLGAVERASIARASARIAGEALRALQPTMSARERQGSPAPSEASAGNRSARPAGSSSAPAVLALPRHAVGVGGGIVRHAQPPVPSPLAQAATQAAYPPADIGAHVSLQCWQPVDEPGAGESIIRAWPRGAHPGQEVAWAAALGRTRANAMLRYGQYAMGSSGAQAASKGRVTIPGLLLLPTRSDRVGRGELAVRPGSAPQAQGQGPAGKGQGQGQKDGKLHVALSKTALSQMSVRNSVSNAYRRADTPAPAPHEDEAWMDMGASGLAARQGAGTLTSRDILAKMAALRGAGTVA